MDLFSILQSGRSRPWLGYCAAVALPLITSWVRTSLANVFVGPYVAFFVVVLVVALIGTRGAAIVATIISALLGSRLAADSGGNMFPQSLAGGFSFISFLLISGAVIFLVHSLRTTLIRLKEKQIELTALNEKLMMLNQELQNCVEERTDALRSSHNELAVEKDAKAKAEEQARHSQKMETIGLLTGGIAHDFNNMLSVIVGSLELIRRRVASGDTDIEKHLDNAMDGAQRSAALTRRLLAISRKQSLEPVVLDLNDRVGGMEDLLQRTLGSKISVRVIKASSLWDVKADPSQFENAVLNLAVNARDAMPFGGALTIETSNAAVDHVNADDSDGQYVSVAVSDTGVGMPKDVIKRAFEPFYTTKPAGEGTGLGLSQIYGFLKQSGGFVKIDSAEGAGTTVKLFLPRHFNNANDAGA